MLPMQIKSSVVASLFILVLTTTTLRGSESAPASVLNEAGSLPFVSEVVDEKDLKTAAGTLKYKSGAAAKRKADVKALKSALTDYKSALKASSASALAQDALVDVLDRLLRADAGRATDEVNPAFARRLVQNGWLQGLALYKETKKESDALSAALAKAMTLKKKYAWKRGTKELYLLADAWGSVAWVFEGAKATFVAKHPAVPMYDQSIDIESIWVQYELAKGADVLSKAALRDASEITVFTEGQELVSWKDKVFKANEAMWRGLYKKRGPTQIDGYFPPHIVQQGLDGEIYALLVKDGVLPAPKDDSESAGEAFLQTASEVMKDGAHLDLIGQYMVKYVYDSPETTSPYLVGSRDLNGDIHQTAMETLSTVTGGVCRGDCDDVSELYHNIIQRQNKLGHVVMLPGHAALAFAEKKGDTWSVYVLQTGPALEFKDAELPKALGKAYKHFGANETFDPNGMGLLLRFSNEKTRGPWRLGWRIFSDKEYAETMIDIQKDWHFQTYLQAIKKMEEMLKDDANKDPANYRELSSLFAFTAQFEKFVKFHEEAVALTKDQVSLLEFKKDYITSLLGTEFNSDAVSAVDELMADLRNPEIQKAVGTGAINFGLEVASACASHHEGKRSLQMLDQTVSRAAMQVTGMLRQLITNNQHTTDQWEMNGQIIMFKRIMRMYVGIALAALNSMPKEERPQQSAAIAVSKVWLQQIAFADDNGPDGALQNYAVLAAYLALEHGRDGILQKAQAADLPVFLAKSQHRAILAGDDVDEQIAWIKVAAPYWAQQILMLVNDNSKDLDKDYVLACDKALSEAMAFADKHSMNSRSLQIAVIQAQVAASMIAQDEKRLTKLLEQVKSRDDKHLRDGVAALMGNISRHIALADYKPLIEQWIEHVNYKPKHYWIAWRAALAGSPEHAVWVAKRAAELFKDDASFVEEYNYMKDLF